MCICIEAGIGGAPRASNDAAASCDQLASLVTSAGGGWTCLRIRQLHGKVRANVDQVGDEGHEN